MALTNYTDCDNKNLSIEQLEKQSYIADIDGKPLEKVAVVFNYQGGLSQVRKTNLTNTAFEVKDSKGNLIGWNIINPNASVVYVKFYDKTAASVNAATDVPKLTLMLPASGTVYVAPNAIQQEFDRAISMRACTGIADTDNTAPGTAIHINALFN